MKKFNYIKLNKSKKIRYLKHNQINRDYIVFLHGFMSDLEGKKPKAFYNFAKKNNLGFECLQVISDWIIDHTISSFLSNIVILCSWRL